MPHLTLEYSANVVLVEGLKPVFVAMHQALAEVDAFPIGAVKSRAQRHEETYIGHGSPEQSFVHVTLRLLGGRDVSVRQRLTQNLAAVLQQHVAAPQAAPPCQLSVEIVEMERSTYFKS